MTWVVGHRGARGECPENTCESFIHAQQVGCERFELDVQLSKDNQLIVLHDTSLKRTTGRSGRASDFTLAELNGFDARLAGPEWPKPCPVPSLEDVLECTHEVNHWQFEVKSDTQAKLAIIAQLLVDLIHERDLEKQAVVTSSNTWVLERVKHLDERITTGYVADKSWENKIRKALALEARYLILNHKLATQALVDSAHESELLVSSWTVNETQDILRLKALKVESIITDYPTRAFSVLGS